jgi:NH3-dependent NAD+ synthetase
VKELCSFVNDEFDSIDFIEDERDILIRMVCGSSKYQYFRLYKDDVYRLFISLIEYLHNEGEIKLEEEIIKVSEEEWEAMLKKEEQEEEQEEEINVQNLDGFLKDLQEKHLEE